MELKKAQEMVAKLQQTLTRGESEYWGDVYHVCQDESVPKEEREYEVCVEYHGEFILDRFGELLNLIGKLTYVVALPTRQIIIW